jgi:hypothetical protein
MGAPSVRQKFDGVLRIVIVVRECVISDIMPVRAPQASQSMRRGFSFTLAYGTRHDECGCMDLELGKAVKNCGVCGYDFV